MAKQYFQDAPITSGVIGFMAAFWMNPPLVVISSWICVAGGAKLKAKPMLAGAFMGAASLTAMMTMPDGGAPTPDAQTETAPLPAPSLEP